MLYLMLSTFVRAHVANGGAGLANRACRLTAPGHEACGHPAKLGAVDIQGNAACHYLWIGLPQAGCGAHIARVGTIVAGFNTRCKLLIFHNRSP
jgi:hypothetical protein